MGTCCWYYANRSTMAKLLVVGLFALVAIACAMPIADNAPEDHSEGTTAVAEVGDKRDGAGGGCCCCPCCECHDCCHHHHCCDINHHHHHDCDSDCQHHCFDHGCHCPCGGHR